MPDKLIDLLKLPKYTFPIVGLSIGKPIGEVPTNKKRMAINSLFNDKYYNETDAINAVNEQVSNLDDWNLCSFSFKSFKKTRIWNKRIKKKDRFLLFFNTVFLLFLKYYIYLI